MDSVTRTLRSFRACFRSTEKRKKNYASVGRLVRDKIFIETLKNFKWTPQHLNELTRWPRKGVKSQITAEARPSVEWNGLLSMDLRQGTLNEHSQELYNVERGILFFI